MSALISLILSIVFLSVASFSGKYVVDAAVKLATLLHIRSIIFGILFVSISTSLPELAVAVFSAIEKESALSFGNLIGSNVINICLIFTILIWSGIRISKENKKLIRNGLFFVVISCVILLLSESLSLEISLFMIILFLFYICNIKKLYVIPVKRYNIFTLELLKNILVFIFACFSVIIFSKLAIDKLISFSRVFGIGEIFLGSTLVAIETSLPELLVALNALKRSKPEISIGDVTGSCVVNTTFILGIAGLLSFIKLGFMEKAITTFALISAISLILFSFKKELSKRDSLILLFILVLFILFLVNFQIIYFG